MFSIRDLVGHLGVELHTGSFIGLATFARDGDLGGMVRFSMVASLCILVLAVSIGLAAVIKTKLLRVGKSRMKVRKKRSSVGTRRKGNSRRKRKT